MTSTPEPRPRYLRLRIDEAADQPAVQDAAGTELGRLVGIVFDLHDGTAAFAIVGRGGLLEPHRPVPWPRLTRTSTAEFALPIADETWRRAPTQPPEAVVDWDDEDVHRRIRSFYDLPTSEDTVRDTTAEIDGPHGTAAHG